VVDLSDLDRIDELDLDVDIVVNNAGIQHVAPIEDFPPERFALILRVMLEAPFRIVRRAVPHMYRREWGRVVNISSVHGRVASPYKSAYVAAKHGLEGLSKVIAMEGAAHGVTSNCINPGYVRTPLVEGQIESQARVQGLRPDQVIEQVMLARTAIKRLIEPEEVAEFAAYLCSPAAATITGASMVMDGGWTAH
jgi:3-hydroxybutyrate dehydrogenase